MTLSPFEVVAATKFILQKLVDDNLISCPGDTIKECMEVKNMNVIDLAIKLHPHDDPLWKTETIEQLEHHLTAVIVGQRRVSNALAICLEDIFGIDKQFWINRQCLYEEKVVKAAAKRRENPFKLSQPPKFIKHVRKNNN